MKQVLLIEDDLDDQEIFCIALKEIDRDIVCHTAEDGFAGIARLKRDPSFIPDFIFIDVNLPKMSGIGCLQELKTLPQLKMVPIFLYSTTADPRIMEESQRLGAEFLVKPANLDTLIRNLHALLSTNEGALESD